MRSLLVVLLLLTPLLALSAAEREVVTATNAVIRIMAANLPGNSQRYEEPQVRIMRGLQPDIVAIQEFRYSNSAPSDIRRFVDDTLGPSFTYFRESGYGIPNGIISRYPIRNAGSWYDTNVTDRGFAWAQIDVPGQIDLFVVSVHLKASSGDAAVRARQATNLKSLITSNFPANSWVVLAGDLNFQTRGESAMATFATFLSDSSVPVDEFGDADTNEPRSRPYDYVLPSFSFQTNHVPIMVGPISFVAGMVFDSRNFSQLAAVSPIQAPDSTACQHMPVMKAFRVPFLATNRVSVPDPVLSLSASNTLSWNAAPGVSYAVEASADLVSWNTSALVQAISTQAVTNLLRTNGALFYRVSF